ncbi:MAG: DMT family transporter [Cocleimonas sp.]|nr:DMT family transporter [Cocleimonas sp.]
MDSKVKGTLYVLLCVALWGLIPVVAKMGQISLDHHQFLFWSSLISFFILLASVIFTRNLGAFNNMTLKDWGFLSLLGLLGTYIYYLFLYLGYSKASGMEVLVVQYTWPIWIVILSVFILRERLTLTKVIAVLLGFSGVFLVLTKGKFQSVDIQNGSVIALVLAGATCFALFSVLNKKVKQEPLNVVTIYFLVATLASFVSMLSYSEFAIPTAPEVIPILLNGVLVNGFSYVFWFFALKSTEASYLAPFTFIAPVLSAFYLILFFDEPFLLIYGGGLMLVIAAGLINSFSKP